MALIVRAVRRASVAAILATAGACGGAIADTPTPTDSGDATFAPESPGDTCSTGSCADVIVVPDVYAAEAEADASDGALPAADAMVIDDTCTPKTCAAFAAECGCHDDGCGHTLECGGCQLGLTCGGAGIPNSCGGPACHPMTCSFLGASCGLQGDGCGALLDCGDCGGGAPCVAYQCVRSDSGCTPRTCAQAHAECGAGVDDGCGGSLDCGACASGWVCGQLFAHKCWAQPVCGTVGDAGASG